MIYFHILKKVYLVWGGVSNLTAHQNCWTTVIHLPVVERLETPLKELYHFVGFSNESLFCVYHISFWCQALVTPTCTRSAVSWDHTGT